MDEYARAAEDLCRVVEAIPQDAYQKPRPSDDPDTTSLQAICAHCVNAAYGYSGYIRDARKIPDPDTRRLSSAALERPADLRTHLRSALHHTEASIEGIPETAEALAALTFQVRWGPSYDPESILEHGIVHLLRHRRQIERWMSGA